MGIRIIADLQPMRNIHIKVHTQYTPYKICIFFSLPTAGDIERDPADPVGDGEGLGPQGCCWFIPPTLSLLLQPVTSYKTKKFTLIQHVY